MSDTRQNKSRWAFRGPSESNGATAAITTVANNDCGNEKTINQPETAHNLPDSFHLPDNKIQVNDSMSAPNQTKYKNISSNQLDPNRYYHGVHPKHLKVSKWSGFWTLINSLALMAALLLQGSLLNYYLIYFNQGRAEWYFLFFTDFVILVVFMFSITFAWRFYQRQRKNITLTNTSGSNANGFLDVKTAITTDHIRFGSGIFRFSFPKPMGMLPLIYICWIFYATNLIVKMYIMYCMGIPDSMVRENFYAPKEVILITLAVSAAVFLFWIEAHWNLGDERQRHLSKPSVDDLISHTAFELFDSLTFLDLVTPDDMNELKHDTLYISHAMRIVVLSFASINFILPTLGLYRLSRTHFGEKTYGMIRIVNETTGKPSTRGLGVSITYHLLRLLAINIPYMVIRIFLSHDSRKEMSIFIVKNVLGILVAIRNLIPEVKQWLRITKVKAKVRSEMNGEDGDDDRIRIKIDPSGRFDPMSQAWELPTIFEAKQITSNRNATRNATSLEQTRNQFNTSTFSNESSVDDIEEIQTGTTNSSPSIAPTNSK